MIRDDSTGGWVPMGGGGLSNVSVRKRAIPCDLDQCKHEYLIFGKRISDQSVRRVISVLVMNVKQIFEDSLSVISFENLYVLALFERESFVAKKVSRSLSASAQQVFP